MKVMGPIWRGTPTRGLEVLCNIRPLELEMRRLAAEQYIRTKPFHIIDSPKMKTPIESRKGHRQWCEEYLQMIGCDFDNIKLDRQPLKFNWEKSYKIDQESMKSDDPRIKGMVQHHKDGVKIYIPMAASIQQNL